MLMPILPAEMVPLLEMLPEKLATSPMEIPVPTKAVGAEIVPALMMLPENVDNAGTVCRGDHAAVADVA
jgi:hypothetical protein